MSMKWDPDKMSTGLRVVDGEHQEWIRRYNEFDTAVGEGQGLSQIQHLLDFMSEYSDSHFVHEEMLAEVEGDAQAIEVNRSEHKKFRQNLREMKKWVAENGASSVEVMNLRIDLEEWIIHHICEVDTKIWADLKKQV